MRRPRREQSRRVFFVDGFGHFRARPASSSRGAARARLIRHRQLKNSSQTIPAADEFSFWPHRGRNAIDAIHPVSSAMPRVGNPDQTVVYRRLNNELRHAQGIKYQPGWILGTAATVKVFIDFFIGVWAFVLAWIWSKHIEVRKGDTVKASEIWKRFPKFVMGYTA
jgi:hypothetical protein